MTGARITIEDTEVQAAFARLSGLAVDPGPLLREIGDNLETMRRGRFLRGQGPGRVPWKPKKNVRGGKRQPLVYSGKLRDTLANEVTGAVLRIGSSLPYAAIHEFGGEIRRYAYSRKVGFRRVAVRREDGTTFTRSLFARTRGDRAHKRVTRKAVTFGERVIRIPARPYLGFDAEDRQEIGEIIGRHIAKLTGATP
jgi:phage gpG-like protein